MAADPEPLVQPAKVPRSSASRSGGLSSGQARRQRSRQHTPQRNRRQSQSDNMLPQGRERNLPESILVRLIATCGIIAIGISIAAIMVSSHSQGWLVGLVTAAVSVALSALLWSSRAL